MFFSKPKATVGVDVGTSYIKIAQVTPGPQPVLDTYGIVNIGSTIGIESTDAEIQDTAGVLNTLLQKARVTGKRCVASLPNAAVFTSVVDMPSMTDDELQSAMQFEAKKYVPLPFAEVDISWSIISQDQAQHTIKVLLIAVPKQVKSNYLRLFELAGLDLEILEIEALALIRSVAVDNEKNYGIIDIGARGTGLNIIKNGVLQLTRNMNVGGDTITDRVAQALNISQVRAEQFKKDFGVSQTGFLPEAIKPVLLIIKTEIKQVLAIYQSHNLEIDEILLVGGGAQLPGIGDVFGDLNIPVHLGNPLTLTSYPQASAALFQRFSLQLPIAIGLALHHET